MSNAFQNPAFNLKSGLTFLGMFGLPNPEVALILLISPFRGIFYDAPILALGVYGLWKMRRTHPAESALIAGVFFTFYLVNCSFIWLDTNFAAGGHCSTCTLSSR